MELLVITHRAKALVLIVSPLSLSVSCTWSRISHSLVAELRDLSEMKS